MKDDMCEATALFEKCFKENAESILRLKRKYKGSSKEEIEEQND